MARRTAVHVEVVGRALQCLVCASETFTVRPVTLITSGVANSGLNKQVDVATCGSCGFLHQFVRGTLVTRPAGG
jgi:hypothetical protein